MRYDIGDESMNEKAGVQVRVFNEKVDFAHKCDESAFKHKPNSK